MVESALDNLFWNPSMQGFCFVTEFYEVMENGGISN